MLAQAASALGKSCKFLAHGDERSCVGLGEIVSGDWNDPQIISRFLSDLDVVTYEFENTPLNLAHEISRRSTLRPNVKALSVSQDRIHEKDLFRALKIPTPNYLAIDAPNDLEGLESTIGFPCLLKTRRLGYDGKGQCLVHSADELLQAFTDLGAKSLIAEQYINFERELSIIGVRSLSGQVKFFPIAQNRHRHGILRTSIVYSGLIDTPTEMNAQRYLNSIMDNLDYVGVLALELFQTPQGLMANEIAPRVHNTGHWSMQGASMSQFEAHIKAISGDALPEISLVSPTVMINLIGDTDLGNNLFEGVAKHVHLYNKEPRPGRKLGHLNLLGQDVETLSKIASDYC